MTKATSYRARAEADCVVLDTVEGQPCWGVVRFTSYEVYLCEGHRSPPDYRVEPVPPTPAELAAMRAEAEAKAAAEAEAYEAGRWFRPLLADIASVQPGPFWTDLSAVALSFLHAGLGDALRIINDPVELAGLLRLGKEATAEIQRRELPWPDGAYDLKLGGPFGDRALRLQLDLLSDDDVQLLYGMASLVADFSCLDPGVRQVVMHVYNETIADLKRRGISPQFLEST